MICVNSNSLNAIVAAILIHLCCFCNVQAFLPQRRGFNLKKNRRKNTHTLAHDKDSDNDTPFFLTRRGLLKTIGLVPLQYISSTPMNNDFVPQANAKGLIQFPCKDLEFSNTYHFLRAGESLLEEEGVWTTNPLFL